MKKIDHKSVYGAGYHAGVLSVTNESKGNHMVMTASRMKQLESQQTGIAKKVYEAVGFVVTHFEPKVLKFDGQYFDFEHMVLNL